MTVSWTRLTSSQHKEMPVDCRGMLDVVSWLQLFAFHRIQESKATFTLVMTAVGR